MEAGSGTQMTRQTVASLNTPTAAPRDPTQRWEVLVSGEGAWHTLPVTGFPPTQTGVTFLVQCECLCVPAEGGDRSPHLPRAGSGHGLGLGASTLTGQSCVNSAELGVTSGDTCVSWSKIGERFGSSDKKN